MIYKKRIYKQKELDMCFELIREYNENNITTDQLDNLIDSIQEELNS